jgi:ABC-type transport system involved in multi-copper enzyme maturation permease subunit
MNSAMNNSVFTRLWAILRTDALLRLRRTSTLVLMLFVSFLAYSTVPDPATGNGLFVINGARTLYNTASIAFATAMLLSLIGIGLFGFYMISNTIRRDVDSRVGNVLAATPMRSWEYIVGKFLGNVAFLSIIVLMYMVAMSVMYAFRGEAPFEVLVFVRTYALMCVSAIVFVSVMALVFESLPVLSGRVGDVAYFVIWVVMIALPPR